MTVQNIKNIKFQPEDFTERYVFLRLQSSILVSKLLLIARQR